MKDHPIVAVIWAGACITMGFAGYRWIVRRIGRRAIGRVFANIVLMIGWMLGVFGMGVLWPSAGGNSRTEGWGLERWTWPRAFAVSLVVGVVTGLLLTWVRRLESYGVDIPGNEPWLDSPEIEDILAGESRAGPEACRQLVSSLLHESRQRQQPIPPRLKAFVERYRSSADTDTKKIS